MHEKIRNCWMNVVNPSNRQDAAQIIYFTVFLFNFEYVSFCLILNMYLCIIYFLVYAIHNYIKLGRVIYCLRLHFICSFKSLLASPVYKYNLIRQFENKNRKQNARSFGLFCTIKNDHPSLTLTVTYAGGGADLALSQIIAKNRGSFCSRFIFLVKNSRSTVSCKPCDAWCWATNILFTTRKSNHVLFSQQGMEITTL